MALAITNQTTLTMNDSSPLSQTPVASRARIWTGRILSGLVSAFLLLDGAMKLVKPEAVVKATVQLGFSESSILGIGLVLVASTLFYIIPRTSVLGAILLTGYLGGAVATQVRAGAVPFNVIFPVVFGVIVWCGLWLRNERLRRALGSE